MIILCRCLLVLVLFSLMGCEKEIDRSMVIGKYTANHKKGTDTLELKSDGTYIYSYLSAAGKSLTNTNKWVLSYQNKRPWITFEKFVFGLPGYGAKAPGFWVVEVERSGKILRLCIDPDLNYYYEK